MNPKLFFAGYSAMLFLTSALFAVVAADPAGKLVNPVAMLIAVTLLMAGFAMAIVTIVVGTDNRAR
jgi:hypothetical protein